MAIQTLKEISKINFTVDGRMPTHEDIQDGCMQRIADATEAMAVNHNKLISDLKMYERYYKEERDSKDKMYKELRYAKALAIRYKNQIKKLKA